MLVAQRILESLAERQPDILHRVVIVDLDVALRFDLDIKQAMAREDIQHMVEERHAGLHFGFSAASHAFSFLFESRLHGPRVIIEPFKPRQMSDAWRENPQGALLGLDDGGALEKIISPQG